MSHVCHLRVKSDASPPSPLSACKYQDAIDEYSKAVDLDPSNAVLYGNRSAAHLKMESYGYALQDASTAIELDKAYVKVCVRACVHALPHVHALLYYMHPHGCTVRCHM